MKTSVSERIKQHIELKKENGYNKRGLKKQTSRMKFHLVIIAVLLSVNIVRGDEDDDAAPDATTELPDLDSYCLEPPPTIDGPCSETKVWTYDLEQRKCVQISGCFEDAGPEYNMFMSEMNCQRWCA